MQSALEFISLHCDLKKIIYSENSTGKPKARGMICVYSSLQGHIQRILQEYSVGMWKGDCASQPAVFSAELHDEKIPRMI